MEMGAKPPEIKCNLQVLKQKIIAADVLVHQYQERNLECRTLLHKIDMLHGVIEKKNTECQSTETKLSEVLGELESLKKMRKTWNAEKHLLDAKVEHLDNQLLAGERTKEQFEKKIEKLELQLEKTGSPETEIQRDVHRSEIILLEEELKQIRKKCKSQQDQLRRLKMKENQCSSSRILLSTSDAADVQNLPRTSGRLKNKLIAPQIEECVTVTRTECEDEESSKDFALVTNDSPTSNHLQRAVEMREEKLTLLHVKDMNTTGDVQVVDALVEMDENFASSELCNRTIPEIEMAHKDMPCISDVQDELDKDTKDVFSCKVTQQKAKPKVSIPHAIDVHLLQRSIEEEKKNVTRTATSPAFDIEHLEPEDHATPGAPLNCKEMVDTQQASEISCEFPEKVKNRKQTAQRNLEEGQDKGSTSCDSLVCVEKQYNAEHFQSPSGSSLTIGIDHIAKIQALNSASFDSTADTETNRDFGNPQVSFMLSSDSDSEDEQPTMCISFRPDPSLFTDDEKSMNEESKMGTQDEESDSDDALGKALQEESETVDSDIPLKIAMQEESQATDGTLEKALQMFHLPQLLSPISFEIDDVGDTIEPSPFVKELRITKALVNAESIDHSVQSVKPHSAKKRGSDIRDVEEVSLSKKLKSENSMDDSSSSLQLTTSLLNSLFSSAGRCRFICNFQSLKPKCISYVKCGPLSMESQFPSLDNVITFHFLLLIFKPIRQKRDSTFYDNVEQYGDMHTIVEHNASDSLVQPSISDVTPGSLYHGTKANFLTSTPLNKELVPAPCVKNLRDSLSNPALSFSNYASVTTTPKSQVAVRNFKLPNKGLLPTQNYSQHFSVYHNQIRSGSQGISSVECIPQLNATKKLVNLQPIAGKTSSTVNSSKNIQHHAISNNAASRSQQMKSFDLSMQFVKKSAFTKMTAPRKNKL